MFTTSVRRPFNSYKNTIGDYEFKRRIGKMADEP